MPRITAHSGLTPLAVRRLQELATQEDAIIAARPRSVGSMQKIHVHGTHLPKPNLIKVKSIKQEDLDWLGVTTLQVDEVGMLNPADTLVAAGKVSRTSEVAAWAGRQSEEVRQLFDARAAEWVLYAGQRAQLLAGGIMDESGVRYTLDPASGAILGQMGNEPAKRLTCDTDMFALADARTRRPLGNVDRARYARLTNALRVHPIGAMHGDHLHWCAPAEERNARDAIDRRHLSAAAGGTGRERLAVFGPTGPALKFIDEVIEPVWLTNRRDWLTAH